MNRPLLWLTLPLFLADQITKTIVVRTIPTDLSIEVVPRFFYLVHWHNTGAAFSMLSGKNGFFIGLSIVALILLAVFARRGAFADPWLKLGAAVLTAGVLGNLADRIVYGHVVDFLLFYLHVPFANPWPAFNVADMCICGAAAVFVIRSFFEPKTAP